MAQRKLADFAADQLWNAWRDDVKAIRQDVHELFSIRRTFRDLGEVFRSNPRLQECGGDMWEWIRVTYASYVIMRIRRETDDQGNTVNLNQLLREIEQRPDVVTRGRFFAMLDLQPSQAFLKAAADRAGSFGVPRPSRNRRPRPWQAIASPASQALVSSANACERSRATPWPRS